MMKFHDESEHGQVLQASGRMGAEQQALYSTTLRPLSVDPVRSWLFP